MQLEEPSPPPKQQQPPSDLEPCEHKVEMCPCDSFCDE
jgi:hypothetical protein